MKKQRAESQIKADLKYKENKRAFNVFLDLKTAKKLSDLKASMGQSYAQIITCAIDRLDQKEEKEAVKQLSNIVEQHAQRIEKLEALLPSISIDKSSDKKLDNVMEPLISNKKNQDKRINILNAAIQLFSQQGFTHTSIDDIAKAANVSYKTVYSHFNNKKDLFIGCLQEIKKNDSLLNTLTKAYAQVTKASLENILIKVLTVYGLLIFDPVVIGINRVLISEVTQFPEISKIFYEKAVLKSQMEIVKFLQFLVEKKLLRPHDSTYAAPQLLHMAFGKFRLQQLLDIQQTISEKEIEIHLKQTVIDFLILYQIKN